MKSKLFEVFLGFATVILLTGIAVSQELPTHPQPNPLIGGTEVFNVLTVPPPGYIYPVTHAKTHPLRNRLIMSASMAAGLAAMVATHQVSISHHNDAVIIKVQPNLGGIR